jgi:phage terminase large subunit
LRNQIKSLGLTPFFRITATTIICTLTGSRFRFKGLYNERVADTVKSLEGANYCWVEEAQTISQNSLDILIPTIREEGSEVWFSLNPRFKEDAVWQMFFTDPKNVPPNSLIKTISYKDNPFFPAVLQEQLEHDKLVSNARYLHVWEGALKSAAGNLLKREWWRQWNPKEPDKYQLRFISADTAFSKSTTADYSVLQLWGKVGLSRTA